MQIEDYSEVLDANPAEMLFRLTWKIAAQQWVRTPAARDWPGGDLNLLLLISALDILDLTHAEDKVAALTEAYRMLRTQHSLQQSPTYWN